MYTVATITFKYYAEKLHTNTPHQYTVFSPIQKCPYELSVATEEDILSNR